MQHAEAIHLEQVKLLYNNLKVVVFGSIFVFGTIVWAVWEDKNRFHLLLMMAIMLITLLLRYMDGFLFKNALKNKIISSVYWEKRFLLGIFLGGVLWGGTFLLVFTPDKPEVVLFIVCFYSGLISSASATTAARLSAFIALVLPATLPIVLKIFAVGGTLYTMMGIAFAVFVMANIVVAASYGRIIHESIKLRFENLDLIASLESEKKRAEKNQQIAENAVIAKDKFLAAASHDLRQPLHAQGLYLDAIESYVQGKGIDYLLSIRKTNQSLSELFNSLLDVSRLNAGIIKINSCHVNLNEIVLSLKKEFESQMFDHQLQCNITCSNITVFIDPVLLARILRNLLTNAIRYTHKGSINLTCTETSKNCLRIAISDTGIGIPDHELSNIFTEYYQLSNPERDRDKGLGLGLAIVKKLCDLMEITVHCDSILGKGSIFSLEIPVGDRSLISCKELNNKTEMISGISVLVIDDEFSILDSMYSLLNQWGSKVVTASSATEAIEKIKNNRQFPNLIIADYRLREEKTGTQAIAAIRTICGIEIPAMLITGDTSEERLREANASGLYLLHKPVAPGKLRAVMHQLLYNSNP